MRLCQVAAVVEITPTIGWRRREEDGLYVIWDLPNGAETVPMLDPSQWDAIRAIEDKWGPLCKEIGDRHQLPEGWLQAMIWRESAGNERAYRVEKDKNGNPIHDATGRLLTGVGLLQITSSAIKKGRTDAEIFNPPINIELGAGYVSYLASRPDVKGPDGKPDFARISAAFNAGSVRPSPLNRWGMFSYGNHVDAEVRALNTWIYLKLDDARIFAAQALAKQFSTVDLLDPDAPAGLRDDSSDSDEQA